MASIQASFLEQLQTGPFQMRFQGLQRILDSEPAGSEPLPFYVFQTASRARPRADGTKRLRIAGPMAPAELTLPALLNHRQLAHPRSVFFEESGTRYVIYLGEDLLPASPGSMLLTFPSSGPKVQILSLIPNHVGHHTCIENRVYHHFRWDVLTEDDPVQRQLEGLDFEHDDAGEALSSDEEGENEVDTSTALVTVPQAVALPALIPIDTRPSSSSSRSVPGLVAVASATATPSTSQVHAFLSSLLAGSVPPPPPAPLSLPLPAPLPASLAAPPLSAPLSAPATLPIAEQVQPSVSVDIFSLYDDPPPAPSQALVVPPVQPVSFASFPV